MSIINSGREMKRLITLTLATESDDETMLEPDFIRKDLEQEICCATNGYEIVAFQVEQTEE